LLSEFSREDGESDQNVLDKLGLSKPRGQSRKDEEALTSVGDNTEQFADLIKEGFAMYAEVAITANLKLE
jgi:hypothetical protein